MYEAVRPFPCGQSTAARCAVRADSLGFDGIVVLASPEQADRSRCARIAASVDVDVVAGTKLAERDNGSLARAIQTVRPAVDLVCVEAGSPDLRRFVSTRDRVDVLLDPIGEDGPIAHTVVKQAATHGVMIALDLQPLLTARGAERSGYARHLRELARILAHYDAPTVLTGRPASHLAMRAPRELIALGTAVGIDASLLTRGLGTWAPRVERNREIRDDSFIGPGVRRNDR